LYSVDEAIRQQTDNSPTSDEYGMVAELLLNCGGTLTSFDGKEIDLKANLRAMPKAGKRVVNVYDVVLGDPFLKLGLKEQTLIMLAAHKNGKQSGYPPYNVTNSIVETFGGDKKP
jgi:hypothetical protein